MITGRLSIPQHRLKINKLFLIGNGFDLALNLKTSYNDFLLWLLKKNVIKAINSKIFIAPIDKYKGAYNEFFRGHDNRKVYGYSSNELFDILINRNYQFDITEIGSIDNIEKLLKWLENYNIEINPDVNKGLIFNVLYITKIGWVDIEGVYFDLLKQIIKGYKANYSKAELDKIENINTELSLLIVELKIYLAEIEISISYENANKYLEQFEKELNRNDFSFLHNKKEIITTDNVYFLNFNYTNSLFDVLSNFKTFKYTQNHIHGNLNDENEQIIFGFGDEMDSVYKEIELLNDNRFFKHIKSFQYFKTPNYRQLLSFLNSGDYQVCIYGHSCGLSDRIMLNEIFENDNCKSIKIYYYNDSDFKNKTMEISRHFNSNQEMRKKIVDINKHDLIPQVKEM